jgi:hypothetical protein
VPIRGRGKARMLKTVYIIVTVPNDRIRRTAKTVIMAPKNAFIAPLIPGIPVTTVIPAPKRETTRLNTPRPPVVINFVVVHPFFIAYL